MTIEINEVLARKVLHVVDAGLVNGMGEPTPGKMCVEAAVNYAMGAPHGDQPACVSPALRSLKIKLNDSRWSSDESRTKGLRRLAIAQLGSAGALNEREFVKRVATLAIQHSVPEALRAAASVCRNDAKKAAMLKAADACEKEPTRENAVQARAVAYAYAAAAYAADAADAAAAAYAAAYAASLAAAAYAAALAADVADAAAAADAAADAAALAAAAYAASLAAAARDKSLAGFCEKVVEILIDMKAPGCQWLWLTEAA